MASKAWIHLDPPIDAERWQPEGCPWWRPGVQQCIRNTHSGKERLLLVGHINPLGGVCDDCSEFNAGDMLVAYRVLLTPAQLEA